MPPLLLALGLGALVVGTFAFWRAIQDWLADVIRRAETDLKIEGDRLYSALVVIDKVIVNGQRVAVATARAIFQRGTTETVTREEQRTIPYEELPADVRARLEHGLPATYELTINTLRERSKPDEPTYKLAVRRAE